MADKTENKEAKLEETIESKVDKAIGILLDQVRTNLKPAEALQQTQAILNMAHARTQLAHTGNSTSKKPGVGA